MTRDEMLKIGFKPYMEIHYRHPRMKDAILCLLIEIDFDEESMTLQPVFGDDYVNKDFFANIQHCFIPKKKMKVVVIDGEKIEAKKNLPFYEGSLQRWNPYFKYDEIELPSDAS